MARATGFVLPLRPSTPQEFVTQLNGVSYTLRTRWLTPSSCWVMDIGDVDNNPMVGSIPLVPGVDLLEQFGYLGIGGALVAYNTQGPPDMVPGFNDLGVTVRVAFVPYAALAAA